MLFVFALWLWLLALALALGFVIRDWILFLPFGFVFVFGIGFVSAYLFVNSCRSCVRDKLARLSSRESMAFFQTNASYSPTRPVPPPAKKTGDSQEGESWFIVVVLGNLVLSPGRWFELRLGLGSG